MNDSTARNLPIMHWLIAGGGLLWNLIGLALYAMTVSATPEALLTAYGGDDAKVDYVLSIPVWATAANALAVTAGVLACGLLLAKRALAATAFLVSIAGLVVMDVHAFVLNNAVALFGAFPAVLQGAVFLIQVALFLYTKNLDKKGELT
ncbi:MAG: hypothetical protein QNJ00_02735 [Woeseiaceae bacterium]|nr:hypothetical protein [Woeseiaceae bacterium]